MVEVERRIYVIAADIVDEAEVHSVRALMPEPVEQPFGRQFAQGVHVARMMQAELSENECIAEMNRRFGRYLAELRKWIASEKNPRKKGSTPVMPCMDLTPVRETYKEYTTIVLHARDSAELEHAQGLLRRTRISTWAFKDFNLNAYGIQARVKTAIITEPISSDRTIGLIDYLPLWGSERHLK